MFCKYTDDVAIGHPCRDVLSVYITTDTLKYVSELVEGNGHYHNPTSVCFPLREMFAIRNDALYLGICQNGLKRMAQTAGPGNVRPLPQG